MFVGRAALAGAIVAGLLSAGCSSGSKAAVDTTTSAAVVAPSVGAAASAIYAHAGSFTVGVTTLRLPGGNAVEVWYPANGAVGVGSDTYDVRSFLPAAVSNRLGPKVHAYVSTDANRNAPVGAPGERFPLVLFSHGAAGFRDESTFLTTWLASWGMVVAAPDHPSRDLAAGSAPAARGSDDLDDLAGTVDLMRRENARAGGPFKDRVDLSKIAAVGFDAGGLAAMRLAADRTIAGYVVLASDVGAAIARPGSAIGLPAKPSLFVVGGSDRVTPPATTTAAFRAAPAPTYEWTLDGAGHNAFTDLCVVAKPQGGLVAFADQSGFGAMFPTPLRTQVSDGCAPPDLPVVKTWPVIDQVVTAFLRHVVGPDRTAVGLGPAGTRTIDGVRVAVGARVG